MYISRIGEGPDGTIHRLSAKDIVHKYSFFPSTVDMAFIYLQDKMLPWFPNITNNFGRVTGITKGAFPDIGDDLDLTNCLADITIRPVEGERGETSYAHLGEVFENYNSFDYDYPSEVGDCGLPVFVASSGAMGKTIVGIHVAGKRKLFGSAVPITSIELNMAKEFFLKDSGPLIEVQMSLADHSVLVAEDDSFDIPQGQTKKADGKLVLGKLKAPVVPDKTSIIPSKLQNKFGCEPKTKPAFLKPFRRDGEKIDPISLSTSKYSRSTLLDYRLMTECVQDYSDFILNDNARKITPECHKRVLTYKEAVAGLQGVDGFDGIPRKTSAGYPWCLMIPKGSRGKQCFWGKEGDYEFDSEENAVLSERVENIISAAREGRRLAHIFFDFPKDERRPIEKVDAGKTRKISGCPVDLCVAVRMYFGAFVQFYLANRIYNGSAVGIDVYSHEVDKLVRYLTVLDSGSNETGRVIAGDFGNFDGSLPYALINAFSDTVTDYYCDRGSENERVRNVLMQDFANSRHILEDGTVYEWVGSNASGNPLTTVLNSWCNNIIIRMGICRVNGIESNYRIYLKSIRKFWRLS